MADGKAVYVTRIELEDPSVTNRPAHYIEGADDAFNKDGRNHLMEMLVIL